MGCCGLARNNRMTDVPDPITRIAQALLYEGYLLWPYRRSALKNQQRWTFGGVYPEPYSTARGGDDPWRMRTQCLLEGDGQASLDVQVRFLHLVRRDVVRLRGDELESVPELTVAGQRHLAWEESTERRVAAGLTLAAVLAGPQMVDIDVPAGEDTEWLIDHDGRRIGAVVRRWQALRGRVEVRAEHVGPDLARASVAIANTTPWIGTDRQRALHRTLISTHTVAHSDRGRFVSLLEPPEQLRSAAEACRNIGTWPVLVGETGDQHTILSSPIILYDYPQIAPESPGDLFDASEIDQLLTLNILTLTDEEKREARETDPRAREILDRCASLSPDQLMRLHGTMRDIRRLSGESHQESGRPSPTRSAM
jgi:hypothetical protein